MLAALAGIMETLVQLVVLVSLPIYLGVRHYSEYESFDNTLWGLSEKFATGLLLAYVCFFLLVGKEYLYSLQEFGADYRKFSTFFIYPSFGFAIAMFPRIAAEYCDNYIDLAAAGMCRVVSIFGWLLLVFLLITVVV